MKKHNSPGSTNTVFAGLTPEWREGVKTKIHSTLRNGESRPTYSSQNKEKKNGLKRFRFILGIILFSPFFQPVYSQVPTCSPDVPYYYVDLTGQPLGTWTSPGHSRAGDCCGGGSGCTSFDVLLDSQAAMVTFNIASGALPSGSLYYQVNCGPQVPVGQPICIVGVGPHHVTFCKPGNNQNTYVITSIAKPVFPNDDTVRLGCSNQLNTLGMEASTVTWNSIYPGASGQYNSYLSCPSACPNPLYTPTSGAPAYIDYEICGFPVADECGFAAVCDTVRIYNVGALTASVSPNPAYFCSGGGGVLLTALASGGAGAYTYSWKDQNGITVGTGSTYQATSAGIYTMEVRDGLYDPSLCPSVLVSAPAITAQPPAINAGPDQIVCTSVPTAYFAGNVQNATGGIWSGGNGTFNPGNTSLIAAYTPTAAEVASGFVNLVLTSTGAGSGCINVSDTVIITYPPVLTVTLTSQSLSCNNSTTTLSPAVSGGIGPYAFNWSNGSASSFLTGGQGNYCVTITDAIMCHVSICANILAPPTLALTMSSVDVSVIGGNDGSASTTPYGGTSPYSYLWSPGGQTSSTATGLSYGIYSVAVTDSNGCTISSSIVVNQPPCNGFEAFTSSMNILCHGDSSGAAFATTSGGTGPYTYSWNTSPAQTTESISGLSAGTYFVHVTEAGGCDDISSIVINEPSQLTNVLNHTNVSTVGASDGSATANAFGGSTPYTYAWSNGETTSTISNLAAGTYSLTITDNNGCTVYDYVKIVEPPCDRITLNVYLMNVTCPGGNNGSVTAQILFGTPPYAYQWSNGQTTSSITGLTAGTYSVVIIDAWNCTDFKIVTVTQPSPLSIALAPTNISCSYNNDGTIELTVGGGTFPYSYIWSNGINVEDQYGLSNGNYFVTVTDANSCSSSGAASITRPSAITAGYVKTDVTCNAGTNGNINMIVGGGIPPYLYSWSNGETTKDISGLSAGQYILTITDANGCNQLSPLSILIDEPELVDIDTFIVNCPVPLSGVSEVILSPVGGNNGPYQVSFDNGVTYLAPGDYNEFLPVDSIYIVLVKDGNGCLSFADTLKINPAVSVSAISFSTCFSSGTSTTPVTVSPAGGTGGPYQISYDNGITFGAAGNYSGSFPIANTYSILVRDSLGCTSPASIITIPDTLSLSATLSSYAGGYNISCNGSSDGNINISIAGGTSPLTFQWSNGSTSEDISGLVSGNYSVLITDANGCSKTMSITLNEPAVLSGIPVITSDYNGYPVSCNGSNDGSVDLTVSGGAGPYQYSWNSGATTEDLNNVGPGVYFVSIVDANGCTHINTIGLTEPDSLSLSAAATHVSCNGIPDGAINLTCIGGVSAYTYNWSNNAVTEDINNLAAGYYSINIADANGCIITTSVNIVQPTILTATISTNNVVCNGESNGTATITTAGGTQPYAFLWSNGQSTSTATGLTANTYSITVSDNNGCSMINVLMVTEPAVLSASSSGKDALCYGGNDGAATVSVSGGTQPYAYQWSNGATTTAASGLIANAYFVTITDNHGCIANVSASVNEPAALSSVINVTSNVLCNGGNSGIASVNGSGGTGPYAYLWSNGNATSSTNGLYAGVYNVLITDANNCTFSNSVTITEPAPISISALIADVLCNGGNNGSAGISAIGGTPSYTYLWSNGETSQLATGLSVGTYSVTVNDANNCSSTMALLVDQPAILAVSVSQTNVSCNGGNNGTATVAASGGTQPYACLWNNGQSVPTASGLALGTYSMILTDANGCTQTASVTVTDESPVVLSVSNTAPACYGESNGIIDLSTNGGVAPYSYSWSNGSTTEDISNLSAGIYIVNVLDGNQCGKSDTIMISQPDSIQADILSVLFNNGYNVSAYNAIDGSISLSVTGGSIPYQYMWSNGDTVQNPVNLSAGNYWVLITDANGCTYSISISLSEPLELAMPSGMSPNSDGKNDLFVVLGLDNYPDNKFLVFNRWGDIVYKKDGYRNDWKGSNEKGKSLPDGTYFVILKVNTEDGEKNLTGYVDIRK